MKSTVRAAKPENILSDSVYNCHPADLPCDLNSREYPFEESPIARTVFDKGHMEKTIQVKQLKDAFGSKLTLSPTNECISSNNSTRINSKRNDLFLVDSIKSPISPLQFLRNPRHARKEHSNRSQHWKTAIDPKSGRTYYYNSVTKATQWRKPIELTSSAEKLQISSKEQRQRQFFALMEKNILKCLAHGSIPGTPSLESLSGNLRTEKSKTKWTNSTRPSSIAVRTISAMNDNVLQELLHVDKPSPKNVMQASDPSSEIFFSEKNYYSPIQATIKNANNEDDKFLQTWLQNGTKSLEKNGLSVGHDIGVPNYHCDIVDSHERKEAEALAEVKRVALAMTQNLYSESVDGNQGLNKTKCKKPMMKQRRNTCGTLYVGETMSAPDKEATIKCVCAVYRAHILQYIKDAENGDFSLYLEEYEIFNDFKVTPAYLNKDEGRPLSIMDREYSDDSLFSKSFSVECDVPSLEEICFFYRSIFLTSKMESDCIIISLIYVEKIMKATNNGVRPTVDNWRSLLFSSMIMASKVWDDLSMWNVDFTEACPEGVTFSLQRINELEMAVLNCLNFKVKVLASEYAKYYFLLRSMLIQSGLGGDDFFTSGPLDMEGAKKLEHASAIYRPEKNSLGMTCRRAKSMGDSVERKDISPSKKLGKIRVSSKAVLEHVVQM